MVCFILHNIAKERRQPDFEQEFPGDEEEDMDMVDERGPEGKNAHQERLRLRAQGFAKRNRIAEML